MNDRKFVTCELKYGRRFLTASVPQSEATRGSVVAVRVNGQLLQDCIVVQRVRGKKENGKTARGLVLTG
jgi:hypothetical protein